jgi:hypothetical protein
MRALGPTLFAAAAALVSLTASAATGRVIDTEGRPIPNARVCHFMDNIELFCGMSKENGEFDIPDSTDMPMRITAEGYLAETSPAVGHQEITLKRAPVLFARLVDAATGEPIEKGKLLVVYSSVETKGPFPTNRAGVRVQRVLKPGEVRLLAKAEGYEDSLPQAVTLKPGEEAQAVLKLKKAAKP